VKALLHAGHLALWLLSLPALAGAKVTIEVQGVPAPGPAPVLDEETAARARAVWATRCALCHGESGRGDGPAASGLTPRPRRLSDAVWQASVSDEALVQVILEGGAARKLSPTMLANPDLERQPEALAALVAFIRSLRAPHGGVQASLTVPGAKGPATASADANDRGVARLAFGNVAPGTHLIVVTRAPSVEHCRTTAVVGAHDITVSCAPTPPPRAPAVSPTPDGASP
jgi:mono/diheme cytochrome c family protein